MPMPEVSFFWDIDDKVEDIQQYTQGGFHPVHLGNIIAPSKGTPQSYCILHKLGWGTFSTVWLAKVLHDLL